MSLFISPFQISWSLCLGLACARLSLGILPISAHISIWNYTAIKNKEIWNDSFNHLTQWCVLVWCLYNFFICKFQFCVFSLEIVCISVLMGTTFREASATSNTFQNHSMRLWCVFVWNSWFPTTETEKTAATKIASVGDNSYSGDDGGGSGEHFYLWNPVYLYLFTQCTIIDAISHRVKYSYISMAVPRHDGRALSIQSNPHQADAWNGKTELHEEVGGKKN